MRIAVVAPARAITKAVAEQVTALAAERFDGRAALDFAPQCFAQAGHFAGDDDARADALIAAANDPEVDAVWFAAGGYGSGRLLDRVLSALTDPARAKTYLGYSDAGFLLGALYAAGFERVVHGPMPNDVKREGGAEAVVRSLGFLLDPKTAPLEAFLAPGDRAAAFNLTILSHLIGGPHEPDLAGHVLMVEEVCEHHYRIDRALIHVLSSPNVRRIAGLRLGRCSDIPENDIPFGADEEAIAQRACAQAGVRYLGRADIGHDAANAIVPFGAWRG